MFGEFFDLGPRRGRNILVLPVPYEGTVSFGTGARLGPEAMFRASVQIESYDPELDLDLADLAHFTPLPAVHPPVAGPESLHRRMAETLRGLDASKDFLLTLGGDHSIPLPVFEFYRQARPDMVILHVDAHADLRAAYEESRLSHACIMARAREMGIPLFQVGIRSVCREQRDFMRAQPPGELRTLFAWELPAPAAAAAMLRDFTGRRPLYISFDVDGMDPAVIPGTGTPEPDGISYRWMAGFWEALWTGGGPELIGMDVCELAPIHGSQVSETAAVKIIQRVLTAWLGLGGR